MLNRLVIIISLATFHKVSGLTCYCESYCPDATVFNGTCEVNENSYCYSAVELTYDTEHRIYKEFRTYGCLSPDESGLMQCRSYLTKHALPKNITCCREEDSCNLKLHPELVLPEESVDDASPKWSWITFFWVFIGMMLFIIFVFLIFYLLRKQIKHHLEFFKKPRWQKCSDLESKTHSDVFDMSSGSGSGFPRLVQMTIGKQLQPFQFIGKGRYGEVWLCRWRGEPVAVKAFSSYDEASWKREKEIYHTPLLRHENILGYIAADISGTDSFTRMLLITDYHELGSLYDYLRVNTLDRAVLLKMALSCVSGICHLHTEIIGTKGKPAIAHRDIKSNNILVKRNKECCIADFGLAVKYCSERDELDMGRNPKVGTKRYMAPEVLDDTINTNWFESLKAADIYSFSLVLWELCRRSACEAENSLLMAADYELPYEHCVPSDPSIEDMYKLVCLKEVRPEIYSKWLTDPILKVISQIMQECWHPNPSVRLTALRIKKTLRKVKTADNIGVSLV